MLWRDTLLFRWQRVIKLSTKSHVQISIHCSSRCSCLVRNSCITNRMLLSPYLWENGNRKFSVMQEGLMGQKPGNTEELLKQSQKELLWLQRQLSFISTGGPVCVLAASKVSSFIIFSVYLTVRSGIRKARVYDHFGLFYWNNALQDFFFILRVLRGKFIF